MKGMSLVIVALLASCGSGQTSSKKGDCENRCSETCAGRGAPHSSCEEEVCVCTFNPDVQGCESDSDCEATCQASDEFKCDQGVCACTVVIHEGGDSNGADTDIGDAGNGDADQPPTIVLEVANEDAAEEVQLISDVSSVAEVSLSRFTLCARGGEVPISSATVFLNGWFWSFQATIDLNGLTFSRQFDAGEEVVLLADSDPVVIADGACVGLQIKTQLPLAAGFVQWIQPSVTQVVSTLENVEIEFEDVDRQSTLGLNTVFEPEAGLVAISQFSESPVIVARDQEWVGVGNFRLCGERYQHGKIRSATFRVASSPSSSGYPIHLSVGFQEPDYDYWILGGVSGVYTDRDTIRWDSNRPDGEWEDLSWGACLNFSFSLALAPQDADFLTLSLVTAEADVPLTAKNYQNGQEWPLPAVEPYSPLPWATIQFVDPVPVVPHIEVNWFDPRGLSRDRHFIWTGMVSPCVDADGLAIGLADCPVMDTMWNIKVPDPRFSTHVSSVTLGANWFALGQSLTTKVVVTQGWQENEVLTREVTLSSGESTIQLPVELDLVGYDTSFRIRAYLVGGIPPEDPASYIAPELTFTLKSATARYVGTDLEAYLNGPDAPGSWSSYGLFPLPYEGPALVFHSPELWLYGNNQGAPQVVSIATAGNEAITIMDASVEARYGSTEICDLAFHHGTRKENPPVQNISVSICGTTFALLSWDQEVAQFTAPEDGCALIGQGWVCNLSVEISNPLEVTDPNQPLQFVLYDLKAYPEALDAPEVPFIIGIEDGQKVYLDSDHPVSGSAVMIIP